MLGEVLKIMDLDHPLAVTEIAQKLGWTFQRVENMLAQLASMGYIQKREIASCSCKAGGCSGCSSSNKNEGQSCQGPTEDLYFWVITERGKSVLH